MHGDTLKLLALQFFLVISTGNPLCAPCWSKSPSESTGSIAQSNSGSISAPQKPARSKPSPGSTTRQTQDWSALLRGVAPQAVKHYRLGQAHLAREHFDRALAEYDVAQKIDKKAPVHEGRARCYAEQGRYKEAAEDLKIAIAQIATAPRYKFLGELLAAQNLDKEAIDAFSAAIKIDAKDFWSYKSRADVYFRQKAFKQAISDYTKLIELEPEEPLGYNCRAKAYRQSGRQDLADKDIDKVRRLMDAEALF